MSLRQRCIENQPSVTNTPPRRVGTGRVAIRQQAGRREEETRREETRITAELTVNYLFSSRNKNFF